MAKIVTWDLETSTFGFKANSGFILCATIKKLGKPVEVLKRDNMQPNPLNDRKLVKQIYNRLLQADMWVTHNGKWFDIPFLNSRLLHWGLPILPTMPHFDTCETSFKKLKIKNSLEAVGEFLGCRVQKYKVSFDEWVKAYAGDAKAFAKIVKHGVNDAKLTEEVYLKMRPLGYKHPNIALINEDGRQCPVCGKRNTLQSRGFLPAKVNRAKRYQCIPSKGGCGTWSHAAYKKVAGVDVRI
jgi:DNA polymerase III epsilon subunit-like protein